MRDINTHRKSMAAMIARASLLLIVLLQALPALAQISQPAPGPSLSEGEFRARDLKLRERALDIEEEKSRNAAWSTGVPISLGLVTLAGTVWAARRTVVAQFTAKAAELALEGEGSEEIINRGKLLADLYEGLLPRESVTKLRELNPNILGRLVTRAPWASDLQKEAIALLANCPDQREQIIADYIALFPEYEFFKSLQDAGASQSAKVGS